jgi:hypothetical protein
MASEYLDDELNEARRDAFEAHVFSCDSCYHAYKQMERTADVLRETPAAAPPADMHQRIMAAVQREAAPEATPAFTWRRAAKVLGGLAAAAALLAAVFVPRGNDATPTDQPVIAEAPSETMVDSQMPEEPATDTPAAEDDEVAAGADEPVAVTSTPERSPDASARPSSTTTSRATESVTPERRSADATEPQQAPRTRHADAGRSEPAEEAAPSSDRPRPSTSAHGTTDPAPRRVRASSASGEQPEPVRETPEQPREEENDTTPAPPPSDAETGETAIAAMPSDSEPADTTESRPAATTSSEPEVVSTTITEQPPKPAAGDDSTRLAVVPRQPQSRTVWRAEETPPSDRLTRMAANINGSQNPRMDNPPDGIELN